MKRVLGLCLLLSFIFVFSTNFAKASTAIPERFASFFEACGIKTEEELLEEIVPNFYSRAYEPVFFEHSVKDLQNHPVKFSYGATTKELISNKKKWDIAVVSSKDVDLQALVDKNLLRYTQIFPTEAFAVFHQCMLPEAALSILPGKETRWSYDVFCLDYDAQSDDATLLIFKLDSNAIATDCNIGHAILDRRPAEMVRKLQGINLVKYWTVDQLINRSEDWDMMMLSIPTPTAKLPDELLRLDEAGLLYDLSQNNYLASRQDMESKGWRTMPRGIFSEDGRMVAVPFQHASLGEDIQKVFIVNKKSAYFEKTLGFGELLMKLSDTYYQNSKNITLEQIISWRKELEQR